MTMPDLMQHMQPRRQFSLDLTPSNFHLFRPLKVHLGGKRFSGDTQVEYAVWLWPQQ
jgi:hypothetical protein